jgi:hypothetical protein
MEHVVSLQVLFLMFTTNHGVISSVEAHPGMSDHNVIITDVNLQTKSAKTKRIWFHGV